MLHKKFNHIAQVVGYATIGLLALYGLLNILGSAPVLATASAALGSKAAEAPVIPSTFNYQGLLRNPDGSLAAGAYTITAKIYATAVGGSDLYHETFYNVTVRDGLFNVVLGDDPQGQDLPGAFGTAPRYIGVTLVEQGDELIPRQRLHAVPWAIYATNASQAVDFNVTGLFTATHVHVSGTATLTGTTTVNGALAANGNVTVDGVAPIRIIRYENKGDEANFNTEVSASDWYCVNAGWAAYYDIDEDNAHTNMVWTYVNTSTNTWWARVAFASHNTNENPDIDIVCFQQKIASWEGAPVTLNVP